MERTYKAFTGDDFTVTFEEHDITQYDVLYHITLKENVKSIKEKGLLLNQPLYKSILETNMLFFSYPIAYDTSDCFRWDEDIHAVIVLDAKAMREDNIIFFNDYWAQQDQSSKRNHLCTITPIDKKYIKKIVQFEEYTKE